MPRPIPTTDEIIHRAKQVHGDKYDYSLTVYKSWKEKIIIICPLHGEFTQKISKHIISEQGCPKCSNKNITTDEFIQKSKQVHGDKYDYSLVVYLNVKTKVKITCKIHGKFDCTPNNHLNGKGCPICSGSYMNTKIFIEKANIKHNNIYNYSLVNYIKSNIKVKIICKTHGVFKQTPNTHLSGSGCPKCKSSKGEVVIRNWLKEHNINFISQKRFSDCRNKQPLPFDFYLPEYNTCIEFDGEQHFTPYRFKTNGDRFIERFKQTQLHDTIKNEYCTSNNIKLLRISYKDYNNIDEILQNNVSLN